MSRVIVKHLPRRATEAQLREQFSQCGEITDVKLVKSRAGVFRHFGFIGFVSETQAEAAVKHFNDTYIQASKISVEVARPYGDSSLPRPWSKYSKGSSAYKHLERRKAEQRGKPGAELESSKEEREKRREQECRQRLGQEQHKSRLARTLGEFYQLEAEPEFQEFLAAHRHGTKVQTWADETVGSEKTKVKPALVSVEARRPGGEGILMTRTHLKFEEDDGSPESEGGSEPEQEEMETEVEGGVEERSAPPRGLSDMEYLRTKVVGKEPASTGGESDTESSESGSEESPGSGGEVGREEDQEKSLNVLASTPFTLKMRGLPFKASEEDVRTFFYPITVAAVRLTTDNQGRPSGRAYVDFETETDMKSALRRNRDCIGRRYIELFPDEGPASKQKSGTEEEERARSWEVKAALGGLPSQEEGIAESGRLFVRNLSYTTTEEQLTELFEKFGPLTEVTVPLDKNSNKPTGIAFITFMLPEHAVRACDALDGQIFRGRLLHLLPAKARQSQEEAGPEPAGKSFKKKKDDKLKAQAGSSHNWNTLFLGANAVVDAMAERYSTDKSSILDPESGHSAAVRVALGETQLVSETREFLTSQGVRLELFGGKNKRSKMVILAKNLPYGTSQAELRELFSPFGPLNRVVLPPAGISALVEFLEPLHAKTAFRKLAYTKFKHLPLYLEWAPLGVMDGKVSQPSAGEEKGEEEGEGAAQEEEREVQCCTVFVKNVNFSTGEEALRKHFSKLGKIKSATIARKQNMRDPAHPLSMGFGFVEFASPALAAKALREHQHSELDGHRLELKLSTRESRGPGSGRRTAKATRQKSAKILVRNVPFEASKNEVKELFRTFGELKTVRLPKKFAVQGEHRGFGFVEFLTKDDAKRAFEALCHSTHLYGRRLVLEWADEGESVEAIRKRTASHFQGLKVPSSKRKAQDMLLAALEDRHAED